MRLKTTGFLPVFAAMFFGPNAFAYSDKHDAETAPTKPLALNEMNIQFRKDYANAKREIREGLGPLVLCINDDMIFLHGNKRETVNFIKPHYTGLKEVSHITLDTFVLLVNHTDEKLSEEKLSRLKDFRDTVAKAAPAVKTDEALEKADDSREDKLVQLSLQFLNQVIEKRTVTKNELRDYVRDTAKPDLENAYEAAGSQITSMDDALAKWRKQVSPVEWQKLYVIIVTHHMPRQDLLAFQYFKKVLNQTQEGDRIIVAETVDAITEDQAIDLLLTHILDSEIAVEFFEDPWRMHRDLLADGTKKWLETHQLKVLLNDRQ